MSVAHIFTIWCKFNLFCVFSTTKKSLGSLDAKEQAKKLIRSGNLKLQPLQERDKGEKSTGFKRSQGLERKLTGLDNARAGYQPFSATHGPGNINIRNYLC